MQFDKIKEFKANLKKFIPKMKDAKEKNLNEADTRMRIRVLLSDVLGYDILEEITQEHMVQGHYVDLTVKAPLWDKKAGKYKPTIIFFIEAKSIETTLRDTHVYQATNYAASGGVNLCLLTNGVDYRLYHLTWDKAKVEHSMILSLNLLDDNIDDLTEKLYLLSKESFKKGAIEKYINEKASLSDRNMAAVLLSKRVLGAIRLELKTITGNNVNEDAIQYCLGKMFDPKLYEMAVSRIQKTVKKENKPSPAVIKETPVKISNVVNLDTKAKDAV